MSSFIRNACYVLVATGVISATGWTQELGPSAPLFDGTSFKGWEGDFKYFRIEDGAIVAGHLDYGAEKNQFLSTTASYQDFELRFRCKLVGEKANGGVQFRSERVPDSNEVAGYQADMGAGWWGSLYDEARRKKTLVAADKEALEKVLRPNDWNDYRVVANGPHIQLFVNNVKTVDYTEEDADIADRGIIAVQVHSGPPAEIWYKDLRIRKFGGDNATTEPVKTKKGKGAKKKPADKKKTKKQDAEN